MWPVIDKLLRLIYRIKPLRADANGIICLELRRYYGRPITLGDGSQIKGGDGIIELHVNNAWFKKRRQLNLKTSSLPSLVLHSFVQDLAFLAEQIANGMFDRVVALHGITLLHGGAKRLGFQVEELPDSLWKKGARFYMAGLMQMYHLRQGFKFTDKPPELREVWLSRAELLARYSPIHS